MEVGGFVVYLVLLEGGVDGGGGGGGDGASEDLTLFEDHFCMVAGVVEPLLIINCH